MIKENEFKEVTDREQELDFEVLFERAVDGITDIPLEELNIPQASLTRVENGESSNRFKSQQNEELELEQFATAQILKVTNDNGIETEEIAVTVFAIVSEAEETPTITPFGSKNEDKSDESYGVKAYSTVVYERTSDKNGLSMLRVTSANGKWVVSDTSIKLSDRLVNIGTSGTPAGSQVITKNPTTNTWSYTAPTTWKPVTDVLGRAVGCFSKVTLKRGTSSVWTLELGNYV